MKPDNSDKWLKLAGMYSILPQLLFLEITFQKSYLIGKSIVLSLLQSSI